MAFASINVSDGQVSGVDALSSACSSLVNWDNDDAGVNHPRSPLTAYSTAGLSTAAINGLTHWSPGYIIGAYEDGTWFQMGNGTPAVATTISAAGAGTKLLGGRRPTFAQGALDLYATAGTRIRRWSPTRVTAEECTGAPECSHIAAIGNRLVANDLDDDQSWRWSALGEGNWSSWPAANATDPDARPDPVVGVFENLNELWIFGTETLQVYQPGIDALNPYDLVSTSAFGLAAPYCCVPIDNTFAFIDNRLRIVISDRRSEESISDAIQKDIRALTNPTDAWGYREEIGQNSQLVIRFPTDRRTFVYDLKAKRWAERAYYSGSFQTDYPVGAYTYWPRFNRHLVGSSLSTGGLYTIGGTTSSDLGGPLVCERVTGWHDHGVKARKRCNRVRATLKRGTGGATAGANGSYELRIQDDDKDWSSWRLVTIGTPNDYRNVVDWFPGGIYRRRRYHIRFSTSEAAALAEMSEDFTELAA